MLASTLDSHSQLVEFADTVVETGTHYFGNSINTTAAFSAVDCSQQCRSAYNNSCNVFTFCNTEGGCLDGAAGTSPLGACNLKVQVDTQGAHAVHQGMLWVPMASDQHACSFSL